MDNFEETFLKRYRKEIKQKTPHVIFDFSATEFADLMELMSIVVAAEHVKELTKASISFKFPVDPLSSDFLGFVQTWHFPKYLIRLGFAMEPHVRQENTYDTDHLFPVTDLADISLSDLTRELRKRVSYYFPDLPAIQIESLVDGIVFEVAENAAIHAYDSPGDVAVCRCIVELPPKLRQTVKSQNSANGQFDSWEYLEESSRKK